MPDLFDSERNLWHVQIRCDHRQCGTRYSIYTQAPTSAGRDDVLYILIHAKRGVTGGDSDHVFDTTMVLVCAPLVQRKLRGRSTHARVTHALPPVATQDLRRCSPPLSVDLPAHAT